MLFRSSARAPDEGTPVLVPGLFVDAHPIESGRFPRVGHRPVAPDDVEPPPALTLEGPHPRFVWGEVGLAVGLATERYQAIDVNSTVEPAAQLGEVVLYHLGRTARIPALAPRHAVELSLARSDLRFSGHLGEILRLLGVEGRPRYAAFARGHGCDLRRFYRQVRCPYCMGAITARTVGCPMCGRDTTRDSPIELTDEELAAEPQRPCPHCGTPIYELAALCMSCKHDVEWD